MNASWSVVLDPTNYSFNVLALPLGATAAAILFFGFLVGARERFSAIGSAFFFMTLPVTIWFFCFTGMFLSKDPSVAFFWSKAAYLGVPFIPSAIYYFTLRVLRLYEKQKAWVWACFAISAFFSGLIIGTDAVIRRLYDYSWGHYPKYEANSVYYLFFFVAVMAVSLFHYVAEYKKPQTDTHRARIRSFLTAFSIASLASVDYLPKFGMSIYPSGYLGILAFIALSAHAMKRYRLVDVTPSMAVEKILERMGDALLVLDAENVIRVANESASALLQIPLKKLIGSPLPSIDFQMPPRTSPESAEKVGTDQVHEIEHRLPDGQDMLLTVSESAMKDHLGCVIATILIIKDSTSFKKTQRALEDSRERFAELYNEMPDAVIVLDEFGRFRSINPAAERLLGLSGRKVAGRIFVMSGILPSSGMNQVLKVIRRVLDGAKEEAFDLELTKAEGESQPFIVRAYPSPVRENGRITALQLILRDPLERKKLEEAVGRARAEMEQKLRKNLDDLLRDHEELKGEIYKLKFFD